MYNLWKVSNIDFFICFSCHPEILWRVNFKVVAKLHPELPEVDQVLKFSQSWPRFVSAF